VPREAAGERLDRWLVRAVAGLSVERVRDWCAQGRVRIRGKAAQASRKLWGGESVELHRPAARRHPAAPAHDPGVALPVLHDDASVCVVNKPAGMAVEPAGPQPSVVTLLAARLRGWDVDGLAQPGVVHRLDRDTSGCLVLPRTDAARAALLQAFDEKQVEKRYRALVLGEPPDALTLDTPYGRSPENPRMFTTRVRSARRARMSFGVVERLPGAALLAVRLETGRTHQIRVQLAEAGFPVLGDAVYGPAETRLHPVAQQLGRHALHAMSLAFPHPGDGRRMTFEAPLPPELLQAMERLREG